MKRIISFALATFFVFMSVFSAVQMDVKAVPSTQNKYDVVYYSDKDTAVNIPGVYQGKEGEGSDKSGGTNFSQPAPLANIFIRESDIDTDDARKNAKAEIKINSGEQTDERMKRLAPYFEIIEDGNHKNLIFFNQEKALSDHPGEKSEYYLYKDNYNYFEGDIVSYRYVDAATLEDGTKADVVFTYSNLKIALRTDYTNANLEKSTFYLFCGNKIQTGMKNNSLSNTHYGIIADVRIQVLKGDTPVDGTYYFRTRDIDVDRKPTQFSTVYKTNEDGNNYYSESIEMTGGYVTTDGYSVYIPGWPNSGNDIPGDYGYDYNGGVGPGYKCIISKSGSTYRFDPGGKDGAFHDDGSFYSGFMAVVNNVDGLQLRVRSSGSSSANVKTLMFANYTGASSDTLYQVKSSTGEGGYIETTVKGNESGKLDDGSEKKGSTTLTVPTGKTMVYTMTPKTGYAIEKIWVDDDSLDYQDGGEITIPSPVLDAEGNVLYYTYTFDTISANKAIHVTWKRVNYTEYYDFYEEGGGTLPPEVLAVKPTRQTLYDDGDLVSAAQPTKTEVIVGNFKYVFEGWDSDDLTITSDDVTFKGKWKKEPYTPPSGGGSSSGGGGGEESSSTPPATDPVDPVTPPATPPTDPATEPLPETFVPSTESDGSETTDGSSGLTVPLGEAEELTIKPVLPEGVVPGPIKKVLVAGVPLGPELYTTDGDAIILKPEYLNLLPEGTYTVRLVYENVWTEAQFAVLGARRPSSMGAVQSARTGDITYGWPVFFAITGATSTAALCGLLHRRKRMK